MQRLGKVSNVTPSRNMVVKAENSPKMGFEVVDENLNVVGKVFDIIGPVSAPYAIIKPSIKDRKSTRLNSSHSDRSRMPSSA